MTREQVGCGVTLSVLFHEYVANGILSYLVLKFLLTKVEVCGEIGLSVTWDKN